MPSAKAILSTGALLASLVLGSAIPTSIELASLPDSWSATPTPVSVYVSPIHGKADNTHTTALNGDTTPIPIVGGSKCWFCPSSRNETGWAIFGLESSGSFTPTNVPAGFSSPLPAITVDSEGNPSYRPSPTASKVQPAQRAETPTQTAFYDYNAMQVLKRTDPSRDYAEGSGWAIKAVWPQTGVLPVPEHYQLIAGYVTYKKTETFEKQDQCGPYILKVIHRDWVSQPHDIYAPAWREVDGKWIKPVIYMDRGERYDWVNKNVAKTNGYGTVQYYMMGPIGKGWTYNGIALKGKSIAVEMYNYNFWVNNCNTFANNLYPALQRDYIASGSS